MDRRTAEGLKVYQQLQMLADNAKIDLDTRTALLGDSREQDFRVLLRALRERVVDATGLLEDGSALGVQGQVQGRVLDSPEFQPLAVPADKAPVQRAARGARPPRRRRQRRRRAQAQPAAAADTSAKIVPAPDLIAAATQAASEALGWTSPDAVLASTLVRRAAARRESARKAARQGTAAPARGRRDPAAAAAAVPQPQDGAARGDRPRRGGPGAAEARQGRTQEVEAARSPTARR